MSKHNISFEPWMCSWPDSSKQGQGFPRRFWKKWCETYRKDPMLHLFCGSSTDGELRVDINENSMGANVKMDVLAFFKAPEFIHKKGQFKTAFADPPYTQEFSDEWGTKCPKPSEILKVMYEFTEVGAYSGILHLQVIRPIKGFKKIAWHPIFCGTTKHIRFLSVFQKE